MSPQRTLIATSIFFAVTWTAGMIWWNATDLVSAIILTICGAIAGVLWFYIMRWWMNKYATKRQ